MNLIFKTFRALFLVSFTSLVGLSATIDFDDLDAAAGDLSLDELNPYQSFFFSNFFAYTNVPGFEGFNNGIVSRGNAAYSGGEVFGTITAPVIGHISAPSLFNFISSSLGAGYYNNLNVTVEGRRGGTLRFSRTVTVGTQGAQPFLFNFTGIDELSLFALQTPSSTDPFGCGPSNCTQFTIDNAELETTNTPEPGAFVLSTLPILALIFFAGTRRRVC